MVGGLAKVFPSMADPGTPCKKRVTVVGDAGFQGTEKRLPGIISVTPHKRTAKKGLTVAQKKNNTELSRERSLIERVFERVKRNTILRVPFRGTAGQFRRLFNTAAGLANLAPASDDIVNGTGLYGKLAAKWSRHRLKRKPRR